MYSHVHAVKNTTICQIVSLCNKQHYVIYNYMFRPCKWAIIRYLYILYLCSASGSANLFYSTKAFYYNTDIRLISFANFNAQFLYSLTICMLHYNPRHVSSINMPIFRRTNCIITASGIVTLCSAVYRE